ncbi:MAG: SAM hydrolase/SAM-dependent halogenase family protein [Gammaproteobacteria bacterium]
MPFAPAGLITLTTDFGAAEPFAGIVRGRILGRFPAARIVDLSHGIPPGRADLAGFWLGHAWLEFPPGTVHLAVVDPGVGTSRRVVLAHAAGRLLLAPDNGLLPEALRGHMDVCWTTMDPALPARLALLPLSSTFHGRDLFAPLAAALASGALTPADFGIVAAPRDPAPLPAPRHDARGIAGRVILADRFGNLFTNVGAELVASFPHPVISAGGREWPLLPTYGDAPPGAPLALINAFGLLELALNGRSAAEAVGLGEGAAVRIGAEMTA